MIEFWEKAKSLRTKSEFRDCGKKEKEKQKIPTLKKLEPTNV